MEQLTTVEMDTNTAEATNDLENMIREASDGEGRELLMSEVATWLKNWYLKCGYKRLGRVLIKFAQEG
jgi:hypothetical protein